MGRRVNIFGLDTSYQYLLMRIGIIGAGHNGLVCAAYLASDRHEVTVFEKNERTGGLCINEELFPGYRVPTVAGYYGMFSETVFEDLGLARFGLSTYVTDPVDTTILPDGHYIVSPLDDEDGAIFGLTVSDEDREGWERFWNEISRSGVAIRPYFTRTGVTQYELQKVIEQEGFKLLSERLFDGSLLDILNEYFENPLLKAAVCAGSIEVPMRRGTIFGQVYQASAKTDGRDGVTGFLRGGLGLLTEALHQVAVERGARFLTGHTVKRIIVENQVATGLELEDGSSHEFDAIISNVDPRGTFGRLIDERLLPMGIRTHLKTPISPISSGKVHLALSGKPIIRSLDEIGHNYSGRITITPGIEGIIKNCEEAVDGRLPDNPVMTVSIPTIDDNSLAPEGRHLMTVDVHHMPVTNSGEAWGDANSNVLVEKVLANLRDHCPGLDSFIDNIAVITPGHLQGRFGLASGHGSHLPMTVEFLVEKRRFPYCGQHTTPISKLYMCGAGTFPGSGVSGAPGYNCARTVSSIFNTRV
ncbi:MAG: phytoene desaturase family protein [Candidatus Obscuribacterales bacterium]